jgi:hypothetical protein
VTPSSSSNVAAYIRFIRRHRISLELTVRRGSRAWLDPRLFRGLPGRLEATATGPGSGAQAAEGAVEVVADSALGDAVPAGEALLKRAGVAGLGGEGGLGGDLREPVVAHRVVTGK